MKTGILILAGVLALAGCSHSTQSASSSNASPSHDPCSLLTTADVTAAIGKPVDAAVKDDDTHCVYAPVDAKLGTIRVEVAWTGADTQFAAAAITDKLIGDAVKAPKVGDASYSSAMGQMFYARKGDAYVGIDMRTASIDVATAGPELARRAIAKI